MRLECLTEEISRSDLLTRIYRYNKQHVDHREDDTRASFADEYRGVMQNLAFPLTIYRGLGFDDHEEYDEFGEPNHAGLLDRIDFSRVGTSWTWNPSSAVVGGTLGGMNDTHVVLTAVVTKPQVDMIVTLFQNLTVYEEEEEVRLYPNTPIRITDVSPNTGIRLPIKANTGPESWDTRGGVFRELGLQ